MHCTSLYMQPGGALGESVAVGCDGEAVGTVVAEVEQVGLVGFSLLLQLPTPVVPLSRVHTKPLVQSSLDMHFSPHKAAGAAMVVVQLADDAALLLSSSFSAPGRRTADTTATVPTNKSPAKRKNLGISLFRTGWY